MPSLTSLAEEMLAQAERIDRILEQNNIPHTSFDEDTLELLPDDARQLRLDLLNTSHNFRQLVRGARLSGIELAYSWTEQVVMRIVWRYKLASAIPVRGSATYQEISAASGLDTSLVIRTIRAAMTLNIFDESEPGRVRHTALSKVLATDEGFYNVIGLQVDDLGLASSKLPEIWENLGEGAEDPNQSAFSLYNGGRPFFAVLAEEPTRAHRFDSAMRYFAKEKDWNLSDILRAYDWSTLDKPGSRLVDLGGGYGQVAQVLAKHTRNLAFTVQDLPHVAEQGQKQLPSEFDTRISFEAQDFMQPQRPTNDVLNAYLISRCLHNWSDRNCMLIFRALIPALRSGSKVLIWEAVIDARPVKKVSEKFALQQDLMMATIFNGKQRSLEEFKRVLELSDTRFSIESVRKPEGSKFSMIVVLWNG